MPDAPHEQPAPPRPVTAVELKDVLAAERAGVPFLLYRDGGEALRIVALDGDATHRTLGRRAGNDVALPWDGEVSRTHAELVRVGQEWTLVDDGLARNGTFVNGERIGSRRRLHDGDAVRVGRTVLLFRFPLARAEGHTMTAALPVAPPRVTESQRRVLAALCRPLRDGAFPTAATNQQIAEEVHLSVDAVKAHLRALFLAFGLADLPQNAKRARLAEYALRSGLAGERDRGA